MGKKKKTDFGFNAMSPETLIKEAKYLVKWNIPLAIQWMKECEPHALLEGNEYLVKQYNRSVRSINSFLDSVETKGYYNKDTYWGKFTPTRLEEVEMLSIERIMELVPSPQ